MRNMRGNLVRTSATIVTLTVALVGCNLQQSYVTPDGQMVVQLAMPPGTPPIAMSRESVLYSVEEDVFFPLVPPTDAQMSTLESTQPAPFARMPWAQRGDYEIEISLVITNLDRMRVSTTATINGINEFNRYLPGFSINDNAIVPDFSQWERTYSLMPGERRTVTVREEELDEVATDLASAVNTSVMVGDMATCSDIANELVYFANQSSIDHRSRMCIPSVVPGLVGIVLGLRAEGDVGAPPPAVAIEASVRLRDIHSRLALTGMQWDVMTLGQTPFTPPMTVQ